MSQIKKIEKTQNKTSGEAAISNGLESCEDTKPWECHICRKRFSRKYHVSRHQRVHRNVTESQPEVQTTKRQIQHSNDKNLIDITASCADTIPAEKNRQEDARENQPGIRHACDLCDKYYTTKHSLKIHIMSHENLKPWECQTCGKRFTRKYHLLRHKPIHQKAIPQQTDPDDWDSLPTLQPPATAKPSNQKYLCKICHKIFSNRKSLRVHYLKHVGKRYPCKLCEKSFTSSNGLKVHQLSHDDLRPWICGTCGKQFRLKAHLNRHDRIHVPGLLLNVCEICGKGFHSRQSLKIHSRSHNDRKQYQCTVCGSSFKYRTSLEMHNKIHQKHKDFACLICKRTFAQKKTLQHHLGVHERVKEKNGYVLPPKEFCDICGRGLSTKAGLRKHLKRHREGTLKIFNRLSNRKFNVIDNKADGETGRHPHEVEVHTGIEDKVQYEVILNDSYSEDEGMETSTRAKQSDLDKTGGEIRAAVKQSREIIGRDSVTDSRKKHLFDKIEAVGLFQNDGVGLPARDVTDVENEEKQNLKDMVQSIEDLIVIVQDKNINNNTQPNEKNHANSKINEALRNDSSVKEKTDNAIENGEEKHRDGGEDVDLKVCGTETVVYRDFIDSEKVEISVIHETADNNGTADHKHSDRPTDCNNSNRLSDGYTDCYHSNKQSDVSADCGHSNRSGDDNGGEYMSSQDDVSDSISDSGELYIHFEYDSDATEIMGDDSVQEQGQVAPETTKHDTCKNSRGTAEWLPSTDQAKPVTASHSQLVEKDASRCQLTEECGYGTEQSEETSQNSQDKSSTCLENISSSNKVDTNTKSSKESSNLRSVSCFSETANRPGIGTLFTKVKRSYEQINTDGMTDNDSRGTAYNSEAEKQREGNHDQDFNVHEGNGTQGMENGKIYVNAKQTHVNIGRKEANGGKKSEEVRARLKCNFCARSFRRKCHLDRHMKRVHINRTDIHKEKVEFTKFRKGLLEGNSSFKYDTDKVNKVLDKTSPVKGEKFSKHSESVDSRKPRTSTSKLFKPVLRHMGTGQSNKIESKLDRCDICNKTFKLHNYFRKHMRQCHPEKEIIYKCMRENCDQTFKSRLKYRHHLKTHNVSICELCGEIFKGNNELVSHVLGLHDSIGETVGVRVRCMICSLICITREDQTAAIDHFKTHLKTRPVTTDSNDKSFQCKVCSKKFSRKQSLKRHTVLHETGEKPVCESCGKVFSQPGHLERHVRSRACSTDFKCSHCDQQFHKEGHLKVHQRKEHKVQAYKCPLCPKHFATSSGMNRHKQFHIEGTAEMSTLKPFMCNICGKCYTAAHSLTVHMVLHTNTRPYQCDQCGNSYTQRAHLQRHVAISHQGIKKFKCKLETCGKLFPDNGALMAHMRTHSGEKPYQCVECGKCFSQASILKGHVKTHSETKDYHCKYCYQQFSTKASAKRHMQRHIDGIHKPVSDTFPKAVAKSSKERPVGKNRKERPVGKDGKERPVVKDGKERPVVKMAAKQFQCELCSKTFTTHRAILAHMKKSCLHRGKINSQTSAGYRRVSDARNNHIEELVIQHSQQMSITSHAIQHSQQMSITSHAIQHSQQMPDISRTLQHNQQMPITSSIIQHGEQMLVTSSVLQQNQQMPVISSAIQHSQQMPDTSSTLQHSQQMPVISSAIQHSQQMLVTNSAIQHSQQMPVTNSAIQHSQQMPVISSTIQHSQQMPVTSSAIQHSQQMPETNSAIQHSQQMPVTNSAIQHSQQMPVTSSTINHSQLMPVTSSTINHSQQMPVTSSTINHSQQMPVTSSTINHSQQMLVTSSTINHSQQMPVTSSSINHSQQMPVTSSTINHSQQMPVTSSAINHSQQMPVTSSTINHSQQMPVTSNTETAAIDSTHEHIPITVSLPTNYTVSLQTTEVRQRGNTKTDLSGSVEPEESNNTAVDDCRPGSHKFEPHVREMPLVTQQQITNTHVPADNTTTVESFPHLVMMSNVQLPEYYQ